MILLLTSLTSCSIFSTRHDVQKEASKKINTNYAINKQYYYCINESCNQATKLTAITMEDLKPLEPFGAGNPKPIFVTKDLSLINEPFVMKEKHLKLKLRDNENRQFEAVWWDGVEKIKARKEPSTHEHGEEHACEQPDEERFTVGLHR